MPERGLPEVLQGYWQTDGRATRRKEAAGRCGEPCNRPCVRLAQAGLQIREQRAHRASQGESQRPAVYGAARTQRYARVTKRCIDWPHGSCRARHARRVCAGASASPIGWPQGQALLGRTHRGLVLHRVRCVRCEEADANDDEHGDARARVARWGPASLIDFADVRQRGAVD